MLCSGAGTGKMYCSKSTGLQDFRAEPTWSYPGSTSPSFPVQMSLRLSSPAWQHSLYTSPHPEPTFWEPALQDLLLHTSYLIFQWVPPHLSWRLLPASQLPFCGVGLIERAVEESSPARSQTRCYFWFFFSFFSHLHWGTTAIQTDCLRLLEVWKTIFFLSGVGGMARCDRAATSQTMVHGSLPKLLGWVWSAGQWDSRDTRCFLMLQQKEATRTGRSRWASFLQNSVFLGIFCLVCLWGG